METRGVEEPEVLGGERGEAPSWFRLRAALVHLYTASGAVLALLISVSAFQGEATRALWLMLATLLVDSTDGLLARRLRVSEALPFLDGARLDDIVDYMTYVLAPMLLLWSEGRLPEGILGLTLAALVLISSSYQFCRVDAKTEDHFFLGFPSYFNVVAFYVIVFELGAGSVSLLLAACSVMIFVPIRYIYPTRTATFRKLSLTLTALWLVSYAAILVQMPDPDPILLAFSLIYLAYYFGMSLYLSARMPKARRMEEQTEV
jgi:phosphatidylcholine synthase